MLQKLTIANFSLFARADLRFIPGLNVIVGENSTGKSHLLKLAYVLSMMQHESSQDVAPQINFRLDERIAEKLMAVFRPDTLGGLVNRSPGRTRCIVEADFQKHGLRFSFAPNSRKKVTLETHQAAEDAPSPVLLPPKEALTLFPDLLGSYEQREMLMDETYYDLCRKFLANPLKPAQLGDMADLIADLETILQGKIFLEQGRFLVRTPDKGKLEIGLLAEGLRKIAQLAYLLRNGSLRKGCTLFWDEPDCNLNPKLIRKVAKTLMAVANAGIQVIIATHSLFLLRELDLLRREQPAALHYTGLAQENTGVAAYQAEEIEDLPGIAALDEELEQSDRYLDQTMEAGS